MVLRVRTIICAIDGARDENASKNDAYHIK